MVLDRLYTFASKIDRSLKTPQKLPFPVVSVGNISSGGRAKTPMVGYLAQVLRKHSKCPVVLTRGYKRRSKQAIHLSPQNWRNYSVEDVGDECLELILRNKSYVLVGKNRYQNALDFIKKNKKIENIVFVLDDGFQHWNIVRDLDIVLYNEKDLEDRVLPLGRLRETAQALSRADLSLKLGVDFFKCSRFCFSEGVPERAVSLTTRVLDEEYKNFVESHVTKTSWINLRDHASRSKIVQSLRSMHQEQSLVLGLKEAVKLVSPEHLESFIGQGFRKIEIEGKLWNLYLVDLSLSFKNEEVIFDHLKGNVL